MKTLSEPLSLIALLITTLSISASAHPFLLVLCYAWHELGHLCFAKIAKAPLTKFSAGAFSLLIGYDTSTLSYPREILVEIGGISFNFVAFSFLFLMRKMGFFSSENAEFSMLCNLLLGLMNFYPISVLDGGGILRSVFLQFFEVRKAEKLSRGFSLFFSLLLWFCAVYMQLIFSADFSLFFLSVFLLVSLCFSL